jgi:Ca-activated chloride channel family protein
MTMASNVSTRGRGLLLAFAWQICLGAALAQNPPDSSKQADAFRFEVEVNLVNVTATVTDKKGKNVKQLVKDDFELYENGKLQEIAYFSADEDAPLSLAILLDTSGSMVDKIEEAGDALKHFADAINPQSEICVYDFDSNIRLVQDFTSDRKKIRRILDQLEADGGTAMYDAVSQAVAKLDNGQFPKKAILLITDGNDAGSRKSFDTVREELQSAEVLLYVIGIGHGEKGSFGHGSFAGPGDEVNEKILKAFTGDTGGRTFIVKGAHKVKGVDVIDRAAMDAAADLYYQYVLSYVSSSDAETGKLRKIKVKVKKKGLRVRARRGYRTSPKTVAQAKR